MMYPVGFAVVDNFYEAPNSLDTSRRLLQASTTSSTSISSRCVYFILALVYNLARMFLDIVDTVSCHRLAARVAWLVWGLWSPPPVAVALSVRARVLTCSALP